MAVLTKRLQILIDTDQFARLEREAARRGVAVAQVVRQAIADALDSEQHADRSAAVARFLKGPLIDVGDWEAVKQEMAGEVDRW